MEYRRLGRTGLRLSRLGYGGLPLFFQTEETAIEAIHLALDRGINYFDLDEARNQFLTDRVYLDGGTKIGRVLRERRGECYLGVKSMRASYDELRTDVDLALDRIVKGTSREVIDIFHLAFLDNRQKLEAVLSDQGGLRAVEEARDRSEVGFILAAGHNPETLVEAIRSGRFDAVEFPFNIIEDEYLKELMPLARQMDVGTVAMKPLGGGQLAGLHDLSLRWLLHTDVDCIIPGMKNAAEVEKSLAVVGDGRALGPDELERLRTLARDIGKEYCHRCGYCMPCPQGIMILGVIDLVKGVLTDLESKKRTYREVLKGKFGSDAENCIACGECVEKCPFDLDIPGLMEKAAEMFK